MVNAGERGTYIITAIPVLGDGDPVAKEVFARMSTCAPFGVGYVPNGPVAKVHCLTRGTLIEAAEYLAGQGWKVNCLESALDGTHDSTI